MSPMVASVMRNARPARLVAPHTRRPDPTACLGHPKCGSGSASASPLQELVLQCSPRIRVSRTRPTSTDRWVRNSLRPASAAVRAPECQSHCSVGQNQQSRIVQW
jgi:hypothetical protein